MSFKPNIYNIPANYHFLGSVLFWLQENFPENDFGNLTIFLPSKRAVREFLRIIKNQNQTLILPKVKAIADIDFEDFIDSFEINNSAQLSQLQSEIANLLELKIASNAKYLLFLAQKIRDFDKIQKIFSRENIGFEQYLSIAVNISKLFDDIEKNGVDLQKLTEIDDSDISKHQQFILKFLRDFYFEIKNSLTKENLLSRVSYQKLLTEKFCYFLEQNQLKNPMIIAGSTGSVSYGRKLIEAIAKKQNGHVILYGFCQNNLNFTKINGPRDKHGVTNLSQIVTPSYDGVHKDFIPIENHPQFVLSQLIKALEVKNNEIKTIKNQQFLLCSKDRNQFVSLSMLPHFLIEEWNKIDKNLFEKSLQNIDLIECEDDFEEAKIIALALQKAHFENKTSTLICNDEKLVTLVKIELEKCNLPFNDGTSQNILQQPIIDFILTILRVVEEFDSVVFLSLLKNNLCFFSQEKYQNILQDFEIEILRQPLQIKDLQHLKKVISDKNPLYEIIKILLNLQNILAQKSQLDEIFSAIIDTLSKLTNHAIEDLVNDEILEIFNNLKNEKILLQNVDLVNFFRSLFSTNNSFFPDDESCKINILSTIEARLLNHDLTIIAALNEGTMPQIQGQNWLGKKIKSDLGVDNLMREIGVNAYDFVNHFCNKEVILTRSKKSADVENIASRFVLKLQILAERFNIKISKGAIYKEALQILEEKDKNILAKISQPNPKIAKELLPRNFAVTDFAKLMSDPYEIFARKILQLKPLKEINFDLGRAEFGSFAHKVLEIFNEQENHEIFWQKAKNIFAEFFPDQEMQLIWWSKFENIFQDFLEKNSEFIGKRNLVEIAVKTEIFIEDLGFVEVKGRVDRIIINEDGFASLFDYKTGGILPTKKQIEFGLEPQLALSAMIIENDEKTKFLKNKIKDLCYWKLSFNDNGEIKIIFKDAAEVRLAIDEANEALKKLLQFFAAGNGFISCPDPEKYKKNDYYHLARIDEWLI